MTVKTITLPTGPETREAFKALGLTLWDESTGQEEHWDLDHKPFMRLLSDCDPRFYQSADRIASAQILQILDMLPPPPGMVLVPRDVAERAESALMMLASDMSMAASRWDRKKNPVAADLCIKRMGELKGASRTLSAILVQSQVSTSTTSPESGKETPNV